MGFFLCQKSLADLHLESAICINCDIRALGCAINWFRSLSRPWSCNKGRRMRLSFDCRKQEGLFLCRKTNQKKWKRGGGESMCLSLNQRKDAAEDLSHTSMVFWFSFCRRKFFRLWKPRGLCVIATIIEMRHCHSPQVIKLHQHHLPSLSLLLSFPNCWKEILAAINLRREAASHLKLPLCNGDNGHWTEKGKIKGNNPSCRPKERKRQEWRR